MRLMTTAVGGITGSKLRQTYSHKYNNKTDTVTNTNTDTTWLGLHEAYGDGGWWHNWVQ